jgi:hypothetical protein
MPGELHLAPGDPLADAPAPLEVERRPPSPHRPARRVAQADSAGDRAVQYRVGIGHPVPLPRQQDPQPLDTGQPRLTADAVESPLPGDRHGGCPGGRGGHDRGDDQPAARVTSVSCACPLAARPSPRRPTRGLEIPGQRPRNQPAQLQSHPQHQHRHRAWTLRVCTAGEKTWAARESPLISSNPPFSAGRQNAAAGPSHQTPAPCSRSLNSRSISRSAASRASRNGASSPDSTA